MSNYTHLYTCDIGGCLDSDMKINFHIVALIYCLANLLLSPNVYNGRLKTKIIYSQNLGYVFTY